MKNDNLNMLKLDLINNIIGSNKHLKGSLRKKDIPYLIRNCHPCYRVEFQLRFDKLRHNTITDLMALDENDNLY